MNFLLTGSRLDPQTSKPDDKQMNVNGDLEGLRRPRRLVFVPEDFCKGRKQIFANHGLSFEREMVSVAEQHLAAGILVQGGIGIHIVGIGNSGQQSLQTLSAVMGDAVRTMPSEDKRGQDNGNGLMF